MDSDAINAYVQILQWKLRTTLDKWQAHPSYLLSRIHNFWLEFLTSSQREKILLYTIYGMGPPFFAHPFKILLQTSFLPESSKASYAKAYKHFRRDHRGAHNLLLHFAALFFQLAHNFGWLYRMDNYLFNSDGSNSASTVEAAGNQEKKMMMKEEDKKASSSPLRPLSTLTGICWAALILKSPAPWSIKALSLGCIRFFYLHAGTFTKNWKTFFFLQGLLDAYVMVFLPNIRKHLLNGVQKLMSSEFASGGYSLLTKMGMKDGTENLLKVGTDAVIDISLSPAASSSSESRDVALLSPLDRSLFISSLAARTSILFLVNTVFGGTLKSQRGILNVGLLGFLAWASTKSQFGGDPLKYILGIPFVGSSLALLTDQPALWHFSSGYKGSLIQAATHAFTGEMATLMQLESMPDVLAHTTYFPNLVFQSIFQMVSEVHAIQMKASGEQWAKGAQEFAIGL
eukprot:g2941.t1